MTRNLLCAAAALAACSSERDAPVPAATDTTPAATPSAGAAPVSDSGAVPRPGALKTFGDWAVGCDNTNRCELRSLAPDLQPPEGVTVSIAREAGAGGQLDLTLDGYEDDDLDTSVDGKAARTPGQIAAAMANGRALIAKAAGKAVATVSLAGASAALRYTDAVQGRAGTVTALVAKGLKPARTVPAAAALPTIVAVAPGGAARTPTAEQLAAMRRTARCDAEAIAEDRLDAPTPHALGGGKTLVLLPCSSGAYNALSAVFVLDAQGFAAATADAPVGFAETGAEAPPVPTVVNGEWRDGVLASFAKARGLGDCGVAQELVWDGTRLRLSAQREMGECRGNTDYITTWRTKVVRR